MRIYFAPVQIIQVQSERAERIKVNGPERERLRSTTNDLEPIKVDVHKHHLK